jgi:hypothetical protein
VLHNLDYGGGPVMASNPNDTLYWSPSCLSAYGSAEYATGINRYLTDVAHDSGGSQNVGSVSAQHGDASGQRSAYSSRFGGQTVDTDPYPANRLRGCSANTPANEAVYADHGNSDTAPIFIHSVDGYVTGNSGCDDRNHRATTTGPPAPSTSR